MLTRTEDDKRRPILLLRSSRNRYGQLNLIAYKSCKLNSSTVGAIKWFWFLNWKLVRRETFGQQLSWEIDRWWWWWISNGIEFERMFRNSTEVHRKLELYPGEIWFWFPFSAAPFHYGVIIVLLIESFSCCPRPLFTVAIWVAQEFGEIELLPISKPPPSSRHWSSILTTGNLFAIPF